MDADLVRVVSRSPNYSFTRADTKTDRGHPPVKVVYEVRMIEGSPYLKIIMFSGRAANLPGKSSFHLEIRKFGFTEPTAQFDYGDLIAVSRVCCIFHGVSVIEVPT